MAAHDPTLTHAFTRDDFAPTPPPAHGFVLTVEGGADAGRACFVSGSEPADVLIGQSPVCALRLADPTVSRRHVTLSIRGARLHVRDLGSTNGTFVGTVRVLEAFASAGDVVSVGRTALRVTASNEAAVPAVPFADHFGTALGTSREMRRIYPLLTKLAASNLPILIEGETGTGKEVVALEIHRHSPRAKKCPFVLFDCTVAAATLIESDLFGHERGAFTGATSQKRGIFEQADRGTLFIDEIGDLPLELQAKLLRAIETGQIRRMGSERWIQVDTRVIAATRRDVESMIQKGTFRDDLFHRLAVGRVALPPLRERRGDVPVLVEHFCAEQGGSISQIPRAVSSAWVAHSWPGNIRELRNAVARQLALGELADIVDVSADAEPESRELSGAAPTIGGAFDALLESLPPYDQARQQALDIFQRAYVDRALDAAAGNVQRAAELAGIALRYFQLLRARSKRS